jgi:hypothetical protein
MAPAGLQFDDDRTIHHKIQSVLSDQVQTVPDLNRSFAIDFEPTRFQFGGQSTAVDALDKTRTEGTMDRTRCFQNPIH